MQRSERFAKHKQELEDANIKRKESHVTLKDLKKIKDLKDPPRKGSRSLRPTVKQNSESNKGKRKVTPIPSNRIKRIEDNYVDPNRRVKVDVRDTTSIQDNTLEPLIDGLSAYLYRYKNGANLRLMTASTQEGELETAIRRYFMDLEDIPIQYTKNQMKADLIKLLQAGATGVTGHLIELLGYKNVTEDYELHIIDYADIDDTYYEKMKALSLPITPEEYRGKLKALEHLEKKMKKLKVKK